MIKLINKAIQYLHHLLMALQILSVKHEVIVNRLQDITLVNNENWIINGTFNDAPIVNISLNHYSLILDHYNNNKIRYFRNHSFLRTKYFQYILHTGNNVFTITFCSYSEVKYHLLSFEVRSNKNVQNWANGLKLCYYVEQCRNN